MKLDQDVSQRSSLYDDDGGGSEEVRPPDRARVRALAQEVVEELRQGMKREGRVLYRGRWRTREEIRWLQWQARLADLARWRDVALVLLGSAAVVAVAYLFLLLLLP